MLTIFPNSDLSLAFGIDELPLPMLPAINPAALVDFSVDPGVGPYSMPEVALEFAFVYPPIFIV